MDWHRPLNLAVVDTSDKFTWTVQLRADYFNCYAYAKLEKSRFLSMTQSQYK